MRRTALSICIGFGLAGCTSSDGSGGTAAIVVSPQGYTLYANDLDTTTTIACIAPCTTYWVPAGSANETSRDPNFGTVTRPDDGSVQVTYFGQPLYTYFEDAAPGQDSGNYLTDEFGSASFFWADARIGELVTAPPSGAGGAGGYGGTGGAGGYGY